MGTQSIAAVLQTKYGSFNKQTIASIENNGGKQVTSNTSIEIPDKIKVFITGSDFWVKAKTNRYKKLIREGHLDKLLKLAEMAPTAAKTAPPDHWFASACSVKRWEKFTLPFFAKLQEVERKAAEVAQRVGTEVTKFIYKQTWKGINVVRWAIYAEEARHAKPNQSKEKHFAWLCLHEKEMLAHDNPTA